MSTRLSVIIPNHNGSAFVDTCLSTLFSATHQPLEVIVVDDGSTDNSADIISRYPCRLIRLEKQGGTSKARNTGAISSQGLPDYSAFESIQPVEAEQEDGSGERDDMYRKVLEFGDSMGEVSISSIQRRFKIGYNRAARIMELLEEDGLVGPPKGAGKPRDFLHRRR